MVCCWDTTRSPLHSGFQASPLPLTSGSHAVHTCSHSQHASTKQQAHAACQQVNTQGQAQCSNISANRTPCRYHVMKQHSQGPFHLKGPFPTRQHGCVKQHNLPAAVNHHCCVNSRVGSIPASMDSANQAVAWHAMLETNSM
jgi:hypothetical protein